MPKSQIVEPAEERKAGTIPFKEVPLNQYSNDIKNEVETYGAEALTEVLDKKLGVMDLTAICLVRDHQMPVRVFNMSMKGALLSIVRGGSEGTLIR